jgi:hypothetical protein
LRKGSPPPFPSILTRNWLEENDLTSTGTTLLLRPRSVSAWPHAVKEMQEARTKAKNDLYVISWVLLNDSCFLFRRYRKSQQIQFNLFLFCT